MTATTLPPPPTTPDYLADPVRLLDELDPNVIEGRLADLARQSAALRELLRATRARRRGQRSDPLSRAS